MKTALLTGTAIMLMAFAAQASDLYAPIHRQNARCGASGATLSHVSVTMASVPMCCPDPASCTQYLSTTKIELPRMDHRT